MCMVEREGEGRGNCKSIVNGINFGQKKETHWITNIILDLFFLHSGNHHSHHGGILYLALICYASSLKS